MNKLEGKTALITGGSTGIGLATAKQFVDEGAYVFITGRREPELAAAVKEIGRNVTSVQETFRTLPISIASLHKSNARRAGSILSLQMPASRRLLPWPR
jgi:NAD(P)-dependent dehydrogenase (short-subunit alcohol dehydrogenase family)